MQMVTATEFKAKCLRLLDEVNRTGEELVISKHGKPVARVVPENPKKPWLALRDGIDRLRTGRRNILTRTRRRDQCQRQQRKHPAPRPHAESLPWSRC